MFDDPLNEDGLTVAWGAPFDHSPDEETVVFTAQAAPGFLIGGTISKRTARRLARQILVLLNTKGDQS